MQAITSRGYGRPADVLRPGVVDEPALDEHEVVVAVHAAALNPADWHLIRGIPLRRCGRTRAKVRVRICPDAHQHDTGSWTATMPGAPPGS